MALLTQVSHILVQDPGVTSTPWCYKASLPKALLVPSVPESNLCVVLPWCPPPEVVFVINKLLRCHLPSVRCCVFSKPIALGWESLPHQRHEEEAVKTHILCVYVFLGLIIICLVFPYPLPSCVNLLLIPVTFNVNFLFLEPATLEPLICCRLACWWPCLPRSCPLLEISRVWKCYSLTYLIAWPGLAFLAANDFSSEFWTHFPRRFGSNIAVEKSKII